MEIRRVQITGGSSYVITLPKDWIKKLNIKKNDPIGLINQPDGTLLITPKIDRLETQREKDFEVQDLTNQNYLSRNLIGAYISGYNSIKIKSSGRMPPFVRVTVRNFIQTTIGQEVVEETDNLIILKDLLNPAEMPFNRTIKRMHILVKTMYEDTLLGIKNYDKDLLEDILKRDNEIDRLHWLVARQHNIILRNINFAEKMETTIGFSNTSFLISRILERIGDHIIRIANNFLNIIDESIESKIIEKLEEAGNLCIEILNNSISAFSKKDLNEANKNIDAVKKLYKVSEKINNLALQQEPYLSIAIGYIIESMRRIGEYSEDISESVINHLIGEEK